LKEDKYLEGGQVPLEVEVLESLECFWSLRTIG